MFTLGADPEMFLQDAAGALISSTYKIGGSKENPRPLPIGEGFAVQEDNVAAEYNIPPAHSADELVHHITAAQQYLTEEISKKGLTFSKLSSAVFDDTELIYPETRVFGCDPDYDAWTGRVNPRPRADNPNLRSCGGHIHVGYKFKSKKDLQSFIKHMDLFLGIPATLMDNGVERRKLYGKKGAFRYKPYGGEYRVLSNFWTFDPSLINWAWKSTELAMAAWQEKRINVDSLEKEITRCINESDRELSYQLVDHHRLLVV